MADLQGNTEFRESDSPDGGVVVALVMDGEIVATARATRAVLDDLRSHIGLERGDVVSELRHALLAALRTQGQFVKITHMRRDDAKPLRFVAAFEASLRDDIQTGVVWYDVAESRTWPDAVPAVVRNKMRTEVHRELTTEGSIARWLVDPDARDS